jgi:hypothetical protein
MSQTDGKRKDNSEPAIKPSPSTATVSNEIAIPVASSSSSVSSHEHAEPHFGSAEVVRDIVIGLSDGLTVPFALAAGLATFNNSNLVVTAGMAEVVAGAISMGLGGNPYFF